MLFIVLSILEELGLRTAAVIKVYEWHGTSPNVILGFVMLFWGDHVDCPKLLIPRIFLPS